MLRERVEEPEQEEELEAAVRELAGAAQRFPTRWLREDAVEWIRIHPWASVIGATALGVLVARIVRARR